MTYVHYIAIYLFVVIVFGVQYVTEIVAKEHLKQPTIWSRLIIFSIGLFVLLLTPIYDIILFLAFTIFEMMAMIWILILEFVIGVLKILTYILKAMNAVLAFVFGIKQ